MKATMVKTSKVNVETDFLNVVKHRIKKNIFCPVNRVMEIWELEV